MTTTCMNRDNELYFPSKKKKKKLFSFLMPFLFLEYRSPQIYQILRSQLFLASKWQYSSICLYHQLPFENKKHNEKFKTILRSQPSIESNERNTWEQLLSYRGNELHFSPKKQKTSSTSFSLAQSLAILHKYQEVLY